MASRSKFFYEVSESSSDEQSISDEKPQKPTYRPRKTFDDEEEETEQKRLVRTEKDKRYAELKALIHNIANGRKINDFGRIFDAFEALCKAFTKAKKVVDAEGIPRFYVATISNLQDYVDECWERDDGSWKRSLDKGTSKYLSLLRQRIRKYNRDFEEPIKAFKEGGIELSDNELGDELGQDAEAEPAAIDFLKGDQLRRFAPEDVVPEDSEDAGSDDWGEDSSDEESSGSSVDDEDGRDTYLSFLKPEYREGKEGPTKDRETAKGLKKRKKRDEGRDDKVVDDEGWEEVKDGLAQVAEKPKMFEKDEDVTHDTVLKKVHEILQSRGKRGFDPRERCSLLVELAQIARNRSLGTGVELYILLEMIGLSLDRERRGFSATQHYGNDIQCDWSSALEYVTQVVDILMTHPEIRLRAEVSDEETNTKTGPHFVLRGCIVTILTTMSAELTRILQASDAFEPTYVDRLSDEIRLLSLVERIQTYLEAQPDSDVQLLCIIYYLHLEHKYFRCKSEFAQTQTHLELIDQLTKFIYNRSVDHKLRLCSILLQAYSLALNDFWFRARDLLLMPFVHDNIWYADVNAQILYNRALVQLGLCAFRKGFIKEAHSALADIHGNNKAKELLAQGIFISRNVERNPEQERADRQRLMPYHLHINLEVLECVYLICAMLTDLSMMSAPDFDVKRRSVSKQFYHQLRITEKQPCYGPPDNMREHIFAAVRAMKFGNWRETCEMLINPKMHSKVWRHIRNYEQVQEYVKTKVKEECLRIFIFNFSAAYDNIKLGNLSSDFELLDKRVKTIVSKMIYNREIMASLDQPTRCLVMHRTHPSTIQLQTIQLADKASQLVDSNDKMATFSSVSRLISDIPGSTRKLQNR